MNSVIGNTEIAKILGRIRGMLVTYFNRRGVEGSDLTGSIGEVVANSSVNLGRALGMFECLRLTSPYLEDEWQWVQGKDKVKIQCQGYDILVVSNKGIIVDYISDVWER